MLLVLISGNLFLCSSTEITTVAPVEVTEVVLFPGEEDSVMPELLEQSQQESSSAPVNVVPNAQPPLTPETAQSSETLSFPPQVAPRNVAGPVNSPQLPPSVLASVHRQIPPYFGNPFRPSIIRSQGASFVALPPKAQPVFDSFLCQKNPGECLFHLDQTKLLSVFISFFADQKRDLEKRSLSFRHLDQFYLNSKNQDVLFSICGELMPAHRIVIESISSKFDAKITLWKETAKDGLIEMNSIDDLLNRPSVEAEKNDTMLSTTSSKCLNDDFAKAFRILLKFFYIGGTSFDEMESLDVGFLVWKMGTDLLDTESVQQQIEPRLGNLITLEDITKVYYFVKQHQIASLNRRWSEFVTAHSPILTKSGLLPLSCVQIAGDIEYLDRFIEALNVNQTVAISYIRQYLSTCPESSDFAVTGQNSFPRSLQYFRCTIDDLKELIRMGFIGYENLAEELENRLRAKELHCEEKCMPKFVPLTNPNYRRFANFNLAPGSTSWRS